MTKPVTGLTVFGASTTGTTTQLDNNFGDLQDAINDLNTFSNYLVDTGSANSIAVTLAANITATLAAGLMIQVKVAATNTGATTLNFNGGGALAVKTNSGAQLVAGNLRINGIYSFVYSGALWVLMDLDSPIKAAVKWNSDGTVVYADNVSSVTDVGPGEFTVNFTIAFNGTQYAAVATARDTNPPVIAGFDQSATECDVNFRIATGTLTDSSGSYSALFAGVQG